MTDVATTASDAAGRTRGARKGLLARAVGVIVSPRETYSDIVANPSVLGAFVSVLLLVAGAQAALLSTDVGKNALLDQQVRFMESFGRQVNDQQYQAMERMLEFAPYFVAVQILVMFPIISAVLAGIIIGVFNAAMGGNATYKQVYAVVIHSGFLMVLQQLFAVPLNYARQAMSSPTNLAVFVPFLDETSFVAMLLGGIDLFLIWLIVNQAIGIAVLYKRTTGPIAMTMLGIYVSIVLIVAGVRSSLSGA